VQDLAPIISNKVKSPYGDEEYRRFMDYYYCKAAWNQLLPAAAGVTGACLSADYHHYSANRDNIAKNKYDGLSTEFISLIF
jgi:hypothetical protein